MKRWHLFLIVAAVTLTLVNIMPTIFYYTKPLHQPIDSKQAEKVAKSIVKRVNSLEQEAQNWVRSYASTLHLKPNAISKGSDCLEISFKSENDANTFRNYAAKAGSLIPFAPSQLRLSALDGLEDAKKVVLQRQMPMHLDNTSIFQYGKKFENNAPTPLYKSVVFDRIQKLIDCCCTSQDAQILQQSQQTQNAEGLFYVAQNLKTYVDLFKVSSPITQRYFAQLTSDAQGLKQAFNGLRDQVKLKRIELEKSDPQSQLSSVQKQEALLTQTLTAIETLAIPSGKTSLKPAPTDGVIDLSSHHPLIASLQLDWGRNAIDITVQEDVRKLFLDKAKSDQVEQMVFNEIARLASMTGETIKPQDGGFTLAMSQLNNSQSFLLMDVQQIREARAVDIKNAILEQWQPSHLDFTSDHYPIWDKQTYDSLPSEERQFGILVHAPKPTDVLSEGLESSSIYIVAKGADQILKKYQGNPNSPDAQNCIADFQNLQRIMRAHGCYGYPLGKDIIFESSDFISSVIAATREDFKLIGQKRYAILEFTDVEQRLLVENRIDTLEHEQLLKWKDEYNTARVSRDPNKHYDFAKPSKNAFINNIGLSLKKYFRGDERKVLKWGLDLSGGKTVRIELRDQNGQVVTDETQITQGMNELYARVNKMGVSEVSIRSEGHHILLDFPGSQNYSASDLVKASSMQFHIVNEKHTAMASRFLQEVWNEATVLGTTDAESINNIAYRHLSKEPRSESAKLLYESGLRLGNPQVDRSTTTFDDKLSKIALIRGESFSDWQGNPTPLIIVFNNYALEGSNLSEVRAGYDPSKGNYLSFSVKRSQVKGEEKTYPSQLFGTWTKTFCKDAISGTDLGEFSRHEGWRMAVILNNRIISSPTLKAAISDGGVIEGNFTTREITKLEADLKAGSLSFAPRILSEQNVSPELGLKDRTQGVFAMIIALAAVIALMSGYYRFAGVIASAAVIFNLLMMWATLQNIQAALTLAGIAGIILTVGMAVDANVLVFERVREEFAISGNIRSALVSGYKKAFTAIIDSNITTLIAALILLNFDSGPIKGFAITLIIGIVSSMFTALFMTRAYFTHWASKPKNTQLKMSSWIKAHSFDFIKRSKYAIAFSLVLGIIGGVCLMQSKSSILGMDFTGGYALNINVKQTDNPRAAVTTALEKAGLKAQDFQVRELSPSNHLRLFLAQTLENPGQPFYEMPFALDNLNAAEAYKNNPRLSWIVDALEQNGVEIESKSLETLDRNWNAVSGQISNAMRSSAFKGLALALLCILLYITIRFEFKYAISATLALGHDIAISLACIALFHKCGMGIQIDLATVAALMTIIGYSLNDTIIVFDRIREDVRLHKHKKRFREIVNTAINTTLSRTLLTSLTTLVVLLALVLLGGSSILGFALIMTVGVVIGTLSSLFIASSLLLLFHKRADAKTLQLVTE
ncbi:MAG: protein translocase subunit SecD [Chlamydiia bacterium]|nr:protein translocase subunit SecD [Chlamydiia bacterium]